MAVRSVFVGMTRILLVRNVSRIGLLLCYALATVGYPIGGAIGVAPPGCQCSDDLRATGACCCRMRPAEPVETRRTCCTRGDSRPAPQSCCGHRAELENSHPENGSPAGGETKVLPALVACLCDAGPIPGFAIDLDPRLPVRPPRIAGGGSLCSVVSSRSALMPDRCLIPETPPPELRAA